MSTELEWTETMWLAATGEVDAGKRETEAIDPCLIRESDDR